MHWFTEGGPLMVAILTTGVVGCIWAVARTRAQHWRTWFDAGVAWLAALLTLGSAASGLGQVLTFQAVSQAGMAQQHALLGAGLRTSFVPLGFAGFWCAFVLAIVLALQVASRPEAPTGVIRHHSLQWVASAILLPLAIGPVVWLAVFNGGYTMLLSQDITTSLASATADVQKVTLLCGLTFLGAMAYLPIRYGLKFGLDAD